ncbi:lanthionine synthetase C family protein [Pedobacter gandavensis]|uniref:lanthionine synthetase C family protein n=1 Tax=Pedobacter gandavensis TaxID=2679963 RepID=UPI00292D58AE|nr:lanthionine synthetase C family protein [Pedobacter gandavensis]
MNYKKEVKEKLFSLEEGISEAVSGNHSMSLMQGLAGLPILYAELYKHTKSRSYLKKLDVVIDKLIDIIENTSASVSFCEGITGVAFMLNYLQTEMKYKQSMVKELNRILDRLMIHFYQHAENYNMDFMHGNAGILAYWLNKKTKIFKKDTQLLMPKYVKELKTYLDGLKDPENDKKIVNCGMAHGLISNMMILAKYSERFNDHQYYYLLQEIVDLVLLTRSRTTGAINADFPAIIELGNINPDNQYRVPLGWCYGDTVVSIGLAKAGQALGNTRIRNLGHEVAVRTMERKTNAHAMILDASFCHGSSSIAHVYNRWRWETNDNSFDEAYTDWILKTVELCQYTDGIGGYKKFEGDHFTPEMGLLDGATGAALVLSDYVYGQKSSWDAAFLLS